MGSMETKLIDLHQIDPRYSHLRVRNERNMKKLLGSIASIGQMEPLLAVEDTPGAYILIDGYQRLEVLRKLDRDQALVSISQEDEQSALIAMLHKNSGRRWVPIEEAGLVQHLHRHLKLSLGDIALRLGRSKSYVKRRLDLIEELTDELYQLILGAHISVWGATRVVLPLARATSYKVGALLTYLERNPTSTRELRRYYAHYKHSSKAVRIRMLDAPELFFRLLREESKQPEGPEERWDKTAKAVVAMLGRLTEQAPLVFIKGHEELVKEQLTRRVAGIRMAFTDFQVEMTERMEMLYETRRKVENDQGTARCRVFHARDSQENGGVSQHNQEASTEPPNSNLRPR